MFYFIYPERVISIPPIKEIQGKIYFAYMWRCSGLEIFPEVTLYA